MLMIFWHFNLFLLSCRGYTTLLRRLLLQLWSLFAMRTYRSITIINRLKRWLALLSPWLLYLISQTFRHLFLGKRCTSFQSLLNHHFILFLSLNFSLILFPIDYLRLYQILLKLSFFKQLWRRRRRNCWIYISLKLRGLSSMKNICARDIPNLRSILQPRWYIYIIILVLLNQVFFIKSVWIIIIRFWFRY